MASDAYSTLIMASSPTAYYRLDEPSGTTCTDSSGNGFSMLYGSGITLNQTGLLASAISSDAAILTPFTGVLSVNNVVSSTYAVNALQVSTAVTVECWFKPTSFSATNYNPVVCYGSDSSQAQYKILHRGTTATNHVFAFGTDTTVTGTSAEINAVGPILAAGAIYHVVGVYDGAHVLIYVNGVLQGSAVATGTITGYSTPYALTLGNDAQYVDQNCNGVVDEVAIYANVALSANTILSHYNAGVYGASVIQYNSGAFSATGFATSLPATPTVGNTLILVLSNYNAGAVTTPGSGANAWTLLGSSSLGTEYVYVYCKIATGTTDQPTITATTPHGNWGLIEIAGGPPSASMVTIGSFNSNSTAATSTTTVTPTCPGGCLLSIHGTRYTATETFVDTPPGSHTSAVIVNAQTASYGSLVVCASTNDPYSAGSAYSEYGTWGHAMTDNVDVQVWIPPATVPYFTYQRAAILAQ